MEKLVKTVIGFGIFFGIVGSLILLKPKNSFAREESWLESKTPMTFGEYRMATGNAGPNVTYRMDETTYDVLKPYGIVARVMQTNAAAYDTVVIMGNKKESFHDPRICFTAQGWDLAEQKTVTVPTKVHGDIKITLTEMIFTKTRERSFAAFFYRGPEGFTPTTDGIKWQLVRSQLRMETGEGVFYRIMPRHTNATEEELVKFIDEFLTATNESSGGIL